MLDREINLADMYVRPDQEGKVDVKNWPPHRSTCAKLHIQIMKRPTCSYRNLK